MDAVGAHSLLRRAMLVCGVIGLLFSTSCLAIEVAVVAEFPVSRHNVNQFATSIAYHDGALYTVNVEPGEGVSTGIGLRTVVRKGVDHGKGDWTWTQNVVDSQTLEDDYHTQASIAVDRHGYIHVAYNMHNMPWQYSVSTRPRDITAFDFRGQEISVLDRVNVKHLNKTPFPTLGSAAIPGNQITYPAFFTDRNGDLYVTYRFATKPRRSFAQREFAGGVARYDVTSRSWHAIGGEIPLAHGDSAQAMDHGEVAAFAHQSGWTPYLVRLAFDASNRMHVSWLWRDGGPGRNMALPAYVRWSDDHRSFVNHAGKAVDLPVSVAGARVLPDAGLPAGFEARSEIEIDGSGKPIILLQQLRGARALNRGDRLAARWTDWEKSPYGATELYVDRDGTEWTIASGPRILRRAEPRSPWELVYQHPGSQRLGFPQVVAGSDGGHFYLYTQDVDRGVAKIFEVRTTNRPAEDLPSSTGLRRLLR